MEEFKVMMLLPNMETTTLLRTNLAQVSREKLLIIKIYIHSSTYEQSFSTFRRNKQTNKVAYNLYRE